MLFDDLFTSVFLQIPCCLREYRLAVFIHSFCLRLLKFSLSSLGVRIKGGIKHSLYDLVRALSGLLGVEGDSRLEKNVV